MIVLALAMSAAESLRLCAIDKVLVSLPTRSEQNQLVVDIRALSDCHMNESVAKILKTAEVQSTIGETTMLKMLTDKRSGVEGGGAYRGSCRR